MNRTFVNSVDAELLAAKHRLLEYARQHPKIAARLRIGNDIASDPHVGRLVQAYALLMARSATRVEETFKELIYPLVQGTGHPHLDSAPSFAIAEMIPDPNQPPDPSGVKIERGATFDTELPDGTSCEFRTCATVDLWPIYVNEAAVDYPPFSSNQAAVAKASRLLRISLFTMAGNITLGEVGVDSLKFYIHAEKDVALRIYEALFCDCLGIWLNSEGANTTVLSAQAIQSVGFEHAASLFDTAGQTDGPRLLNEFGLLPEKFLFFEVTGLQNHLASLESTAIDLNILLGDVCEEFPTQIDTSTIRLGCVPIVNLFERTTEPEEFHAAQSDVEMTVDSRNHDGIRIHNIHEVTLHHQDETTSTLPQFTNADAAVDEQQAATFWLSLSDERSVLRFVNGAGEPTTMEPGRIEAVATCSNGLAPSRFGDGGDFPALQPMSGAPVTEAGFLTRPTRWRNRASAQAATRRINRMLVQPAAQSQDSEELTDSFRELFAEALKDAPSPVDEMARAIAEIRIRRVTGTHGRHMMCHGLEVSVQLDDDGTIPGGIRLFAEILRRVLAGYVSSSTFVRYQITSTSGKDYGSWPIISGERFSI